MKSVKIGNDTFFQVTKAILVPKSDNKVSALKEAISKNFPEIRIEIVVKQLKFGGELSYLILEADEMYFHGIMDDYDPDCLSFIIATEKEEDKVFWLNTPFYYSSGNGLLNSTFCYYGDV